MYNPGSFVFWGMFLSFPKAVLFAPRGQPAYQRSLLFAEDSRETSADFFKDVFGQTKRSAMVEHRDLFLGVSHDF